MLASIIANLQNVPQPEAPSRLPTIKIDRGGGGGPSWPSYDIVDIMAAVRLFPEVVNEDPVARAVRRRRWIGEALPHIKEARERREASAFLAGAVVADAAAEERHRIAAAAAEEQHRAAEAVAEEHRRLVDQLKIEQIVEIIDEVRGISTSPVAAAMPRRRGQYVAGASPVAIAVALGVGVAIGVALGRRRSHA